MSSVVSLIQLTTHGERTQSTRQITILTPVCVYAVRWGGGGEGRGGGGGGGGGGERGEERRGKGEAEKCKLRERDNLLTHTLSNALSYAQYIATCIYNQQAVICYASSM